MLRGSSRSAPPLRNPTYAQFVESLAGPVRELQPGDRPADWLEAGVTDDESPWVDARDARDALDRTAETHAERLGAVKTDVAAPARPLRYKVQFTADQAYVDLVQEAFDLLGHDRRRRPDLPELHLRALRLLVEQLRRRKRATKKEGVGQAAPERTGVSGRPVDTDAEPERKVPSRAPADRPQMRAAPERRGASGRPVDTDAKPEPMHEASAAGPAGEPELVRNVAGTTAENPRRRRHVPAAVRRVVWARDDDRCAYVDDRGCRCREQRGLELHHREPHARGGPSTVENLELRCRAHNALAAEQDFGPEHMRRVRPAPPPA